ncbi:uncharacterized protein LOC111108557 isoform X1 [Crassostrea virginica]
MDTSVLCSYSLIFVLLRVTAWFPEQCNCTCISQQCNDSTNNEINGQNAKLESLRISIETKWNTLKEKRKPNNLWTCLTNKTCPLRITRKKKAACLCSDSICARTICKHTMKSPNRMRKYKCNIKVNTTKCSFPDEQLTEKEVLVSDNCSVSKKKRYFFQEGKLHFTEYSDISTRTTITMLNPNSSNDPTSGKRSNFWNIWEDCSDLSECSFFVMSKGTSSSTYVCVSQIHKNYCYRLRCSKNQKFQKKLDSTNNTIHSTETESNHNWKDAVLVFFGMVLSAGVMAIFVGAHRKRRNLRNLEVPIIRGRTEQRYTCNSGFYAEINDLYTIHGSKDEEIGKETLDKELDEKEDKGKTQGVCYRREAGSDDAYSNVYNVLQPNYGTERTVPVVGPNNKR